MTPQIGDIESIEITSTGLDAWEKDCRWPELNDSALRISFIFSRLYLVLGWLLVALGQYGDALTLLARRLNMLSRCHQRAKRSQSPFA